MSQCYVWLPVLISITLVTLKSLRSSMIVMIQYIYIYIYIYTHTHTYGRHHKLYVRSPHSLLFNSIESQMYGVQASNLSPQSSAEINNGWSFTSAIPYGFTMYTVTKWSFSLPYEIRNAQKIPHDHWTRLQDTVQCNEP